MTHESLAGTRPGASRVTPTFASKNFLLNLASVGGTVLLSSRYHFLTTCPLQKAWILEHRTPSAPPCQPWDAARPQGRPPQQLPKASEHPLRWAGTFLRLGDPPPGRTLYSEESGPVVNHSGLILVLSTERTGFFISELFKSLKACLKKNISLKILRVITYKQHFYF